MKFTSIALTLATAGSLVAAQPHRHMHHHIKRAPDVTDVVSVPGPTVIAYEFEGHDIPADQVCAGIASGKYKFQDGQAPPGACQPSSSSSSSATPTSTVASSSSVAEGAQFYEAQTSTSSSSSSSYVAPSTSATPTSSSAAPTSATPTPSSSSSSSGSSGTSGGSGVGSNFPDGELSCDTFPSEYGAVALDYLGLGGWSGIQYPTYSGSSISNIVTGVSGDSCTEGAMCSYACPAGWQKAQWPTTQGSTGQSVGGITCSGGKLKLTNPSLSQSLCIQGTGNVQVQNTLTEAVAVCRTDYPGTESETIPLAAAAGSTQELTCPDASNYYVWENLPTSAQYYVNPKGVSIQDGCQWGSGSNPWGNFAPVNLGVGTKDGATWLSIMANKPTTDATLDFSIEIKGDNLSGSCKYENGAFISLTGSNDSGCTVQVMSGTATYVFS